MHLLHVCIEYDCIESSESCKDLFVICFILPHSGATNHPWISVNLPEPYGILQPQSDQSDIVGPCLSQAAVFAFLSSFGSVIGGGSVQESTGWKLHICQDMSRHVQTKCGRNTRNQKWYVPLCSCVHSSLYMIIIFAMFRYAHVHWSCKAMHAVFDFFFWMVRVESWIL